MLPHAPYSPLLLRVLRPPEVNGRGKERALAQAEFAQQIPRTTRSLLEVFHMCCELGNPNMLLMIHMNGTSPAYGRHSAPSEPLLRDPSLGSSTHYGAMRFQKSEWPKVILHLLIALLFQDLESRSNDQRPPKKERVASAAFYLRGGLWWLHDALQEELHGESPSLTPSCCLTLVTVQFLLYRCSGKKELKVPKATPLRMVIIMW